MHDNVFIAISSYAKSVDILPVVENGLITGFFAVVILVPVGYFAILRLKSRMLAEMPAMLNGFVAELMNDAVQHPEKLKPVIDALVNQGMGALGISKSTGPRSMKIGPLRIPMELVEQFAPLLLNKMQASGEKVAEKAATSVFG
jgi:hypothetical protein